MVIPGGKGPVKNLQGNFPGGPVVKNLPYNAGDTSSIPGQGTKIPHATGQLSPRATTTELARLNERACMPQLQSPCALEPVRATTREEKTHTPQLERSPRASMKILRAATRT